MGLDWQLLVWLQRLVALVGTDPAPCMPDGCSASWGPASQPLLCLWSLGREAPAQHHLSRVLGSLSPSGFCH